MGVLCGLFYMLSIVQFLDWGYIDIKGLCKVCIKMYKVRLGLSET